jgi:hypothetical protein
MTNFIIFHLDKVQKQVHGHIKKNKNNNFPIKRLASAMIWQFCALKLKYIVLHRKIKFISKCQLYIPNYDDYVPRNFDSHTDKILVLMLPHDYKKNFKSPFSLSSLLISSPLAFSNGV